LGGRQAARIGCCCAFCVAGDLQLRLDETGLGRSNHEIDVTAVGVGRAVLAPFIIGYVVAPPVVIRQATALWGWD
jgi:hypothetical protein